MCNAVLNGSLTSLNSAPCNICRVSSFSMKTRPCPSILVPVQVFKGVFFRDAVKPVHPPEVKPITKPSEPVNKSFKYARAWAVMVTGHE